MKTVLILAITLLVAMAVEARTALDKHINNDLERTPTGLPPTTTRTTLVSPKERRKSMLFPKNPARFTVTEMPKIRSNDAITSYFNQKQTLLPKINVNSNKRKSPEVTTISSEYEGIPRIRPSLVRLRSTTTEISPNSDGTKERFTSDVSPLENSSVTQIQNVQIDTTVLVDERNSYKDTTEKVTRRKSLKVKVHKKPVSSSEPEDKNSKTILDKSNENANTTQKRDDNNLETEAADTIAEEIITT